MDKIAVLNSPKIVDWSCTGEECEYVLAQKSSCRSITSLVIRDLTSQPASFMVMTSRGEHYYSAPTSSPTGSLTQQILLSIRIERNHAFAEVINEKSINK
ncbi:hypothetical protein FHS15_005231 [Paenibacillus castaneae]|nr:hypothetical protein [Paenibacillus castaneae]